VDPSQAHRGPTGQPSAETTKTSGPTSPPRCPRIGSDHGAGALGDVPRPSGLEGVTPFDGFTASDPQPGTSGSDRSPDRGNLLIPEHLGSTGSGSTPACFHRLPRFTSTRPQPISTGGGSGTVCPSPGHPSEAGIIDATFGLAHPTRSLPFYQGMSVWWGWTAVIPQVPRQTLPIPPYRGKYSILRAADRIREVPLLPRFPAPEGRASFPRRGGRRRGRRACPR